MAGSSLQEGNPKASPSSLCKPQTHLPAPTQAGLAWRAGGPTLGHPCREGSSALLIPQPLPHAHPYQDTGPITCPQCPIAIPSLAGWSLLLIRYPTWGLGHTRPAKLGASCSLQCWTPNAPRLAAHPVHTRPRCCLRLKGRSVTCP